MRVLGLTGGIAMGKSTVAVLLRRARIPVFDADAAVRALQGPGGAALPAIAALVPDAVTAGRLDRSRLRRAIAHDAALLPALEAAIHPLVRNRLRRFLDACRRRRVPLAVLEVPLLFEAGLFQQCDLVLTVSAPAAVQRARLRRRGLPAADAAVLIARQLPDRERRRRADAVIRTGLSRRHAEARLRRLLRRLPVPGEHCAPWNARSCSTPRPPASIRRPATASSRSRRSS